MNIVIIGCGNIGFETAKLLLNDNKIYMIDIIKPEHLDLLLKNNINLYFSMVDATNLILLKETYKKIISIFGKVDALLLTVGIWHKYDAITTFEEFKNSFYSNLFGNLVPIKIFLENMINNKSGKIILLLSSSGHHAPPSLTAYPSAKWALNNLSRSLREELRKFNITIEIISPSTIRNKYSNIFTSKEGLDLSFIAKKISDIIQNPKNSNHYIPKWLFFLHLIERLKPSILDKKFGLTKKKLRKKKNKNYKIKNVLITGASSGLGKKLAYLYSTRVEEIYLIARNYKKLLEVKANIQKRNKCNVYIESVDISNPNSINKYLNKIDSIDLLINNAGYSAVGNVLDISINAYRDNFAVNFFGAVQLISEFLSKSKRPKKIINILSTTAIAGRKGISSYSATKSALWCFTKSLRRLYGNEMHIMEVLPATFTSNFSKNTVSFKSKDFNKNEGHGSNIANKSHKKLTAEKVAKKIFNAEKKGKEILLIPLKAKFYLFLEASFPSLFNRLFK